MEQLLTRSSMAAAENEASRSEAVCRYLSPEFPWPLWELLVAEDSWSLGQGSHQGVLTATTEVSRVSFKEQICGS